MLPINDKNPTHITPYIMYVIIISCIAIFIWQITRNTQALSTIMHALGATPAVLLGDAPLPQYIYAIPEYVTIFSSMFLHVGWLHLLSNMMYLWVFGNNIEEDMGHIKFILFYLICGTIAVFAHAIPNAESTTPMVGASGAISGILGAYLLLYPKVRIIIFIPILFFKTFNVQAMWILLVWITIQILQSVATIGHESGGAAFGAHIGGFIAGMLLCPFFKNKDIKIRLFK